MRPVLALLALTLALLAGCGTTPPAETPADQAPPAPQASLAAPATLTFPALGIEAAPLGPTGLTGTGELAVPPLDRPEEIVYANWDTELAQVMPTVLASHVNGRDAGGEVIPGGFARLDLAERGDELAVTRADGTSTRYRITEVETVDKDTFPTEQVYAPGPPGRIVLITCGGEIDTAARSYESNVIVSASAV